MFLTEEQAAILICDRSKFYPVELREEFCRLRDESKGIYCSVLLDTGARLHYDKYQKAFYLTGNHPLRCDVMSIYDHLVCLDDYYFWFLTNIQSVNKVHDLEMRKRAYKQYKLNRLKQVA